MSGIGMEALLKRIAKVDREIADLGERLALKHEERKQIVKDAQDTLNEISLQGKPVATHPYTRRPGRLRGPGTGTPHRNRFRSLTDAQVREIRAKWATGKHTQRALGEKHGVTEAVISQLIQGTTYKDVE